MANYARLGTFESPEERQQREEEARRRREEEERKREDERRARQAEEVVRRQAAERQRFIDLIAPHQEGLRQERNSQEALKFDRIVGGIREVADFTQRIAPIRAEARRQAEAKVQGGGLGRALGTVGRGAMEALEIADIPRQKVSLPLQRRIISSDMPISQPLGFGLAGRAIASATGIPQGPRIPERYLEEAASVATDPLNLAPGIGFGGDIARVVRPGLARYGRAAAEALPGAARAAVEPLGMRVPETVTGARRAQRPGLGIRAIPEAEAPPPPRRPPTALGGEPPGSGEQQALAALDRVLSRQPKDWEKTLKLRSAELEGRVGQAEALKAQYLAEGMSPGEAIWRSESALKGKLPVSEGAEFGFTREAEAWMWDRILTLDRFKQDNLATMLREMALDPKRVVRPFEKRYLEEAAGQTFAAKLETASRARATADEAMRMAKAPQGVTGEPLRIPRMGEEPIGTQTPLWEFASSSTPFRQWPAGWTQEQILAHRRLSLMGQPGLARHSTLGEPIPSVAESLTLPGINAPVATAKQVLPESKPYLIDVIADSLGLPRAIMSSADLSFLRQTGKTVGRHPGLTRDALQRAATAALSEESAVRWMKELEADPFIVSVRKADGGVYDISLGQLAKEKLHMAVPGTPGYETASFMSRPEFFISRWGSNLPIVRQSGRAFGIGINTTTQGLARYWLGKFMKLNGGAISETQLDAVLNLSNRLVGRGELGTSWIARTLKAVGFAPGYRVSGPQVFANLLRNPLNPENRQIMRMAAEELFTWASAGSALLTTLKYGTGASVVLAIGSPHFGRVQFPGSNTMYNIWGTDQVLARTIMQALSKTSVDRLGNVRKLGSGASGPEGYLTAARDAFVQYLRSGEDPIIQLLTELGTGQTYLGEKLGWNPKTVLKLVGDRMPMAAQDIVDVAKTDGPIQSLISAPFALLGGGISSYQTSQEKVAEAWNRLHPEEPWVNDSSQWMRAKSDERLAPVIERWRQEGSLKESPGAARAESLEKTRSQTEQELQMPMLAQAVLRGDKKAGPAFAEAWTEYTRLMVGANKAVYLELSPKEAKLADGKALDEYYGVKLLRSTVAPFEPLYEEFDAARATAMAKMSPALRAAVENPAAKSLDPFVQQIEPMIRQAKDLRGQLYDLPKWKPSVGTPEEQKQIQDVQDLAREKRRELRRTNIPSPTVYNLVAKDHPEIDRKLIGLALKLQNTTADQRLRNPERERILTENQDLLELFFPELYTLGLLERISGFVPESAGPEIGAVSRVRPLTPSRSATRGFAAFPSLPSLGGY